MHPTEAEQRILAAARIVFERDGFAGARMQRIADEAGMSKASLHYYFRSKEKLFERIFDEYVARIVPVLSTWEDDSDDWQPKVRTFMRDLLQFFSDNALPFLVQELRRDPDRLEERLAKKRKKPSPFAVYYDRLRAKGLVRDVDPRMLSMAMHGLCAYPQINSPMIRGSLRMKPAEYDAFLLDYVEQAAEIMIRAMKK